VKDPSSAALTALLIVRLVFRISSVNTDAVLRADADHFGFPGVVEEMEEEHDATVDAEILKGERLGRRAIKSARYLMEGVNIRDATLMGWITEMIAASLPS
jgi:chromatin structure-remodeling complex subunit RSC9